MVLGGRARRAGPRAVRRLRRRRRRPTARRRRRHAEFNAANGKVFNPSDKKGGTLKLANSERLGLGRPGRHLLRLLVEPPAPVRPGADHVQAGAGHGQQRARSRDLAEGLGMPSDGGKTWTYKLRAGPQVRGRHADHVQGRQVRGAALDRQGDAGRTARPTSSDFLDLAEGYKGPYKSKGVDTDRRSTTPDDKTIVFHLKAAVRRLRLLRDAAGDRAGAGRPRTPAPSTRSTWSPPGRTCSSSTRWARASRSCATRTGTRRPTRTARRCRTRYEVKLDVNADDIDNRLISGDLDVDVAGTGVQPAALGRVVGDPALQGAGGQPGLARGSGTPRSTRPWRRWTTSSAARRSMYAADRTGYQTAYGGPLAGGDIATTLLPPQIPGYQKFDLYPAGADNKGDVDEGQGGADRLRPAERLRDQHGLPGRAAEGEGDRRVAAAVAGPGRHQADAEAVPDG